jgi:hypothetical protein
MPRPTPPSWLPALNAVWEARNRLNKADRDLKAACVAAAEAGAPKTEIGDAAGAHRDTIRAWITSVKETRDEEEQP